MSELEDLQMKVETLRGILSRKEPDSVEWQLKLTQALGAVAKFSPRDRFEDLRKKVAYLNHVLARLEDPDVYWELRKSLADVCECTLDSRHAEEKRLRGHGS